MANFPPLHNYILHCINQLINGFGLSQPFLDVGCGNGAISENVASRGWSGKAIDLSDVAIGKAKQTLRPFTNVEVEKKSLFEQKGSFNTIFLVDVLEHIENDTAALEQISSLLSENGYVIIVVPSNPREWRWDDDFYGHFRRYSVEEIMQKLVAVRIEPLVCWDITYPVFWVMRRIYTRVKSSPKNIEEDKLIRTIESSSVNAWNIPILSKLVSQGTFVWGLVQKIQFKYFKNKLPNGCEMMILGKKSAAS